jgi:hypothetical protein
MEQGASDAVGNSAVPEPRDDVRARRQLWRMRACGEFVLELAILPGDRWVRSKGAALALLTPVSDVAAVEEGVLAVWDLAREDPPPRMDRVYAVGGDGGRIVVAHTMEVSLVARSGGPYLLLADRTGKAVWRIDGDEVWAADLDEVVRELFEVAQGRPAIDESQIPPMPPLPWHQSSAGSSEGG